MSHSPSRRLVLKSLAALPLVSAMPAWAASEFDKVLSPAGLAALEDVVVLDIRSPKAFAKGHIPDALNAPYPTWRGPKENPGQAMSDARLTERLQSLGLTRDSQVVVAHQGANETDFGAAARVYWTLKSAGLTRIGILNGGTGGWAATGLTLSTEPTTPTRSGESFALAETWRIDRAGVADVIAGKRNAIMVDARPVAFFEGKAKHKLAERAGTIEGALQLTHDSWFTGSKTEIVTGPQVRAIAEKAGYRPGGPELVSFCNTGHWAATNWFALSELAGIEGVRLYPESMVGWANAGGALVRGN
ncbi:MAG: rhodanese-like domain-containing protein [Pseudomonadota bacterium]